MKKSISFTPEKIDALAGAYVRDIGDLLQVENEATLTARERADMHAAFKAGCVTALGNLAKEKAIELLNEIRTAPTLTSEIVRELLVELEALEALQLTLTQ